jgi:ABC-type nitrate/sulfonate/bicarbonate transport system substrate-binding protein
LFAFALILTSTSTLWAADVVRVGYPSLATGFAASWVTADKGIWKKHGLDVELIFLRGGSRTVSALIG